LAIPEYQIFGEDIEAGYGQQELVKSTIFYGRGMAEGLTSDKVLESLQGLKHAVVLQCLEI
jgi:hypothetical protein